MHIWRWQNNIDLAQPLTLTIGNFDGVHRGHQQILHQLQQIARHEQTICALMSFFPHPRSVIAHEEQPLLSTLRDRARWLRHYGLQNWLLLTFNNSLRHMEADDFVRNYLVKRLRLRHLLIGDDFRFGYRGSGDCRLLRQLGQKYSFKVTTLNSINHLQQRVSSSSIRSALAQHDIKKVNDLLGHALTLTSVVRHGYKRGRQMTTPTLNLHIAKNWAAPDGVYVVRVRQIDSAAPARCGVANVGAAPTFNNFQRKIEVHILDAVMPNLYGKWMQVEFIHFLRPTMTFASAELLRAQIATDIATARAFINS